MPDKTVSLTMTMNEAYEVHDAICDRAENTADCAVHEDIDSDTRNLLIELSITLSDVAGRLAGLIGSSR